LYSIFKEMREAEAQELRTRQGALDLGGVDLMAQSKEQNNGG
jgi:hypothetical protein